MQREISRQQILEVLTEIVAERLQPAPIPIPEPEKHLGLDEAAARLGICSATLRRWCTGRGCPHIRVGDGPVAPYRVSLSEVKEWARKEFGREAAQ